MRGLCIECHVGELQREVWVLERAVVDEKPCRKRWDVIIVGAEPSFHFRIDRKATACSEAGKVRRVRVGDGRDERLDRLPLGRRQLYVQINGVVGPSNLARTTDRQRVHGDLQRVEVYVLLVGS